jgi:hypothetical protein
MKCIFCNKEINNKGGLIKHQNGCKYNPNRIIYKSHFTEYNDEVRNGLKPKNKNQYQLAKEKGECWSLSKEGRLKLSNASKGRKLSNEVKEKLSLIRSKIIEEQGKGGFKNIKWYKIFNIEKEEFILRGTWELKIANLLNDNNILWIRKIYLNYIDNKIKRTYCPDFYLPKYNLYLEVKGYFSIKDKDKMNKVIKNNKINLVIINSKMINNEKEILNKITGSNAHVL